MPLPIDSTSGKVILVTGGNRGIGLATVRELQRRGAKVVAGARDPQRMPPIEGVMTVELDTADARSCRDSSTTPPDEISTSGVPAAIARCTSTSLQANLVTGGSLPAAGLA
jgi:NAD(P)-dependent dehydrogenase (short-subunit alcohol dehydrogenase family)